MEVGGELCQWALTRKRTLWGDGALELLEHAVLLDAARDDDGRGNAQPLVPKVDRLGRLCALELVDLKRVPVHAAKGGGDMRGGSAGTDTKANHSRAAACKSEC